MDRILDTSASDRGILEKILHFIPGFRGYLDREWRRESDKLEREYIARKLGDVKSALREVMQVRTHQGGLEGLSDFDRADKKLDKLVQRIRFADQGYSAFFGVVKVKEVELDKLLAFDLKLIETVHEVGKRVASIQSATDAGAGRAELEKLIGELDAFDRAFGDRDQVMVRG